MDSLNHPIAIDTTQIDEYGYYYFYQIREADYLVKARLRSISAEYGNFIPTYYGDSHIWNEADIMSVDSENWSYHINLITSEGINDGAGSIQGQILYDTNTITTTYAPAENIELVLLNNEEKFLTCRLSDLEGNFGFNNLEYGTYQIYPDVTGILSDPLFVTVSENSENNYNLVIQPEYITFGLREGGEETPVTDCTVYPNPVKESASMHLVLEKNARINLIITDLKGAIISEDEYHLNRGSHRLNLPTAQLSKGVYQIMLYSGTARPASLKMIKL
jgi:hypothetical protein